jgi:aminopeptidase N
MKKVLVIFALLFSSLISMAQEEEHACASAKIRNKRALKIRAANPSDNALLAKYDVHFYGLDLKAENNSMALSGRVDIASKVVANNLDTFAFELHQNHTIDSVLLNGVPVSFVNNIHMRYALLGNLVKGTNFTVSIYYGGTCPTSSGGAIGNGFNMGTSPSWGNAVTWSLSESKVAYEWWPCKMQLMDKADSCAVSVTTTLGNRVGSQGILQSVDTLPNNKVKYNWRSNAKIVYYLISIAVAQYVDYSFYVKFNGIPNGDSILCQNYVYNNPGTLPNFKNILDTTANMLKEFSTRVSLYPYYKEKYGHAMAPLGGGMEHTTMSTVGAPSFDLDAHELFHQWFGDNVTCATWKDIWVNEGFASYGEYMAREWIRNAQSARNKMNSMHNSVKSSIFGSVHFTDTLDEARIFSSRLTYNKGGAIVHTLRYLLGDSIFFKTLGDFQNAFADSNGTSEEFRKFAEQKSGMNLQEWMDQWYYGQGWPIYSAIYNNMPAQNQTIINLKHITSNSSTPLFTNPIDVLLQSPSGDTLVRLPIKTNNEFFVINTKKTVTGLVIDPNNWIIDSTASIIKSDNLYATNIDDVVVHTNLVINQLQVQVSDALLAKWCYVLDASGRVILKEKIAKNVFHLNMENAPSGNYIFKVDGFTQKFNKQ